MYSNLTENKKLKLCLYLCNTPLVSAFQRDKPGKAGTWKGKAGKLNTKPVLSKVAKI